MKYFEYLAAFLLGASVALIVLWMLMPKYITVSKASDTEWELSKPMPDTTISDTLLISGVTVYPTVQYLNIKIK